MIVMLLLGVTLLRSGACFKSNVQRLHQSSHKRLYSSLFLTTRWSGLKQKLLTASPRIKSACCFASVADTVFANDSLLKTSVDEISEVPKLPVGLQGMHVLTVGDGDMSFSAGLAKLNICQSITATTWDSPERLTKSFERAADNVQAIEGANSAYTMRYGVDATKLIETLLNSNHADRLRPAEEGADAEAETGADAETGVGAQLPLFDTILWNFPHVAGKQNIKHNRELLRRFFVSARELILAQQQLITTDNQLWDPVVKISLCGGQSGTEAANMDEWNYSWKLVHQAAEAGFLITAIERFDDNVMALFDGYQVKGHRGHGGHFPTREGQMFTLRLPSGLGLPSDRYLTDEAVTNDPTAAQFEQTAPAVRAVQAPMYSHEVHLLATSMIADLRQLEQDARQAVIDIVREYEDDVDSKHITATETQGQRQQQQQQPPQKQQQQGSLSIGGNDRNSSVWGVNLVDVYTCPRTLQISHTFQITYCSLTRPIGRTQADALRTVVEQKLPLALGMVPRDVKHGGMVSLPYPWYVTLAARNLSSDFSLHGAILNGSMALDFNLPTAREHHHRHQDQLSDAATSNTTSASASSRGAGVSSAAISNIGVDGAEDNRLVNIGDVADALRDMERDHMRELQLSRGGELGSGSETETETETEPEGESNTQGQGLGLGENQQTVGVEMGGSVAALPAGQGPDSDEREKIRAIARTLWVKRIGVLIYESEKQRLKQIAPATETSSQ